MKPNFPKHSCVYKSIKIQKPYKFASLNLIFFLAFLFSCQEQEVEAVYPEEAAINGYIGLQDSEKLNEAFMQAKEFVNRPNRRTNFPFQFSWDMVDHSRVLQIVQNGNGNYSNYTFSIEQKDESNFLNLVLKEQADGFYGALFEYHYLTDANGTLVNTIERINKYSLDGRLISQYNTDSNNGNTNRLLTETCYKASVEWLAFDGSPCDPFEFEEEDDGCWETVVLTPVSCIQSDPHGGGNDDGTNEDVDDWGTPLPDPEIGGGTSPGGSSSGEPSSPEDDGGSPSAPGEAQDELIGLEPPLNGPSPLPQCGDGEVRVDGVCIDEELLLAELWEQENIELSEEFENNPCAKGVYDDLMENNIAFDVLSDFFGDNPKANLEIDLVEEIPTEDGFANGKTYAPSNGIIKIELSKSYIDAGRSNLEIARTLCHEFIHAELYYKYTYLDKSEFYDLFREYTRAEIGTTQHNLMVQFYLDKLSYMMSQFDSNINGVNFHTLYESGAWLGLEETDLWEDKTEEEKAEIENDQSILYNNRERCQ
ncbi:hypothetical protein MATR_14290 [Marivirga tractuosa]|uniref:Uncharacterized protein n=1 Tax=Marivirga tractuosa (strain ATCC 23168 / DSM 4126 / NBRC 15989 / NCIMB 1408 / VKM B-1430 / H-43) TaxID=643867 RepID=E4TTM8_MARTH|nr:SprT-like domain-containing protein [Marivirga tractuosa]ADR20945.1 hypothetical protein Ftrac_0943 [Marivirga tractuosa DSM 4126]BDD14604.1 hypothetical protein MATR_14290 [Marivirga tractuosa]